VNTLNEEIGNRNVELSGAYNDLTNVLNGVNLPVVILETNLRIRRSLPLRKRP
jgi:two-component system CheB/CheR fusion protein